MASEFSREFFSANRIVKADLHCARQPREQDLDKIKAELKSLYDATEVLLDVSVDESLLSGYVLQVGDRVFDNSGRHALDQMTGDKPDLATLKTRVEDYKPAANTAEGGTVVSAADGIVTVEGMDRAVYGEIVTFENGAKGMVESVEPSHLGIMLFDGAESVGVGTLVTRTGKRAGIPVGEAFLGRVINPLGEPIDGKGAIEAVGYNPIEKQAPGILERQSVDTPLHTGILSIDSMFPIGRGQRELIIGDRQTGKTSIATDTILNQKDTGVLCIYVAIGQKASSIARVAEDLKKHGAMGYTTIVAATASDSAPLQYIAPYAGTALAEYFMAQGKSVLIVYDDLSKHAVAYRAISLLLRRSPGREAYPGDVFYLHSRLLERSCRMRDDLGGGSITALPIVETQAGDVSAYIPTNVISITDGQIFLETALFNAGNRPAVNVGLSVSRVGGAAQTKAMKKANANLRIELAQYKDMESFSQFSSDLDAETRRQLEHGKALMELLKQPLYQPKSDAEQVVLLTLAAHGVLDEIKTVELRQKTSAFVRQFRTDPSGVMTMTRVLPHLPEEPVHPFFHTRNPESPRRAYLVLTADKGMAGAYNQNLLKFLKSHCGDDPKARFYVVGQTGYRALLHKDPRLVEDFLYSGQAPTLQRARDITADMIDTFKADEVDEVYLIYTKIQNALTAEPVMLQLLPLERSHFAPLPPALGDPHGEVELFPDAWSVFKQMAPIYMHGMIFGAMTESYCAEQSARMTAMDSATKSATDMIHALQLEYNRTRQGAITQEITEIIGGASAVQTSDY